MLHFRQWSEVCTFGFIFNRTLQIDIFDAQYKNLYKSIIFDTK